MCICAGTCGAIKNDSVYNDATLACSAVVAGSLLHNLTVLRKNGQLLSEGCSTCDLCDIV